jgi:hypothetical protein
VSYIAYNNFIKCFSDLLELEKVKHHALNYKLRIQCLLEIRLYHLDLKFFHQIIGKSLRSYFASIEIVLILLVFQILNFYFFLKKNSNYFSKSDWTNLSLKYLNYLTHLFAFYKLFWLSYQT